MEAKELFYYIGVLLVEQLTHDLKFKGSNAPAAATGRKLLRERKKNNVVTFILLPRFQFKWLLPLAVLKLGRFIIM